jgi:serine/threonine protein kinase
MEFQGGGNLYQMLKTEPNNPAFSYNRLINLIHGIASGLEMLHSMNIVHRDIAARNILVSLPKSIFGSIETRTINFVYVYKY